MYLRVCVCCFHSGARPAGSNWAFCLHCFAPKKIRETRGPQCFQKWDMVGSGGLQYKWAVAMRMPKLQHLQCKCISRSTFLPEVKPSHGFSFVRCSLHRAKIQRRLMTSPQNYDLIVRHNVGYVGSWLVKGIPLASNKWEVLIINYHQSKSGLLGGFLL